MPFRSAALLALCAALAAGCAARVELDPAPPSSDAAREAAAAAIDGTRPLLSVARLLHDGWRHLPVGGTTDYRIAIVDGALAVSATGAGGASGLIRRAEVDPARCRTLRWTWRVDALQASADLRTKAGDDVGAAVYVLFGDPGLSGAPAAVPTLKYVWAGGDLSPGEILPNPYLPDSVMTVAVATRDAPLGRWRREERDLMADYEAAFGRPPENWIEAVAFFTDNDQTGQAVTAHYRDIAIRCTTL
ncbi:MAG: DUF3047 domain-containing protein [Nitratireductor sp.]